MLVEFVCNEPEQPTLSHLFTRFQSTQTSPSDLRTFSARGGRSSDPSSCADTRAIPPPSEASRIVPAVRRRWSRRARRKGPGSQGGALSRASSD
eukprot:753644-Hanusia_phi.AAC.5